ncbi:MAG TPA: TonB C-terminal domain-containing protein [Candidatus Acidoferrales bacterium]|nr:TonB C-terminal domain-containing protein [Candidatus Acidoferrales bacterium]
MIARILVPRDVRPLTEEEAKKQKPPARFETYMDDRMVVPSGLSDAPPLNGKSSIPSHLPLGVLVDRALVPRDIAPKPFDLKPITDYVPVAVMDPRVVVPVYVEPPDAEEIARFDIPPEMTPELREVIQPDIFTTGDANLLIEPQAKKDAKWDAITRAASVAVHIGLIIFIIFIPKMFPPHIPTTKEIELASKSLGITYIPVDAIPSAPPGPPGPKVKISPKVLNKVAPPRPETHAPIAPPSIPKPELPSAPTPHTAVNQPSVSVPVQPTPTPSQVLPVPPSQPGHLNLNLPNSSPGKQLQSQIQDQIQRGGGGTVYNPGAGGGGGGGGGGGRGGMQGMQPGVSILSDTQGVDFNSYLQRLLATVKRNWYTVMPESALMGDRGIVMLTFKINRDGSVPPQDPNLERTSGKQPLDTAALSSIRTSSPFEPLPPQFKGDFIELRFIYFYNIPPDSVPTR